MYVKNEVSQVCTVRSVSLLCSLSFTFVYKTVKEYPLCPSLSAMSAYVQPYSRKRGELSKYCLIIIFLSTHLFSRTSSLEKIRRAIRVENAKKGFKIALYE